MKLFEEKSFWMTTRDYVPGPALKEDLDVDMAIVGDQNVVYSLGCMGHGVSLTHLNGRTLADLVLEKKTDLTDVFFVSRTTLPWPPEPIRTLSSKAILAAMKFQDRFTD